MPTIDFTHPGGIYPTEAMDWNTGNPFDVSKSYPATAGILFLGRDHDCAHTKYFIDGGLILELETSAVNQAFGLYVARPAGLPVNQIHIVAVFDFFQSLKRVIRTSGPPQTVPFIGSVGVVANNADVLTGLSDANDKRIAATCALNYDPDADPAAPGAPPSHQRLKLNAPGTMFSNPRPINDFHDFEFLRAPLPPKPVGGPLEFTLEMTATAAAAPDFAMAWMQLSVVPAIFGPDGGPTKIATSKIFHDFDAITYAGVALAITDTDTTWIQPSMGPLRVRIKRLEVDFT
jgi:hypothetical protein